jgi:two-component system, chemotaxis family, chemotaxis protein CheY
MSILGMPDNLNFLLLDDYEVIRALPRKEILDLGFKGKIFEEGTGNAGFKILEEKHKTGEEIGFIISDLMMPDGSGHDLLIKVRADARFKNIPFLLLTTENDRAVIVKSIQLGVTNCLLKPFSKEQFIEKITFCWNKHHAKAS